MARRSPSKNSKNKPKATKAKGNGSKAKKKKSNIESLGLKNKEEVAHAVFKHMCEEHSFGMTEWTREDLANTVGFTNPRTEKFSHGLKLLIDVQGLAQKGSSKGTVQLSPEGIAQKPKDVQPTTLEAVHKRYLDQLERKVACGANCVRPLWKILLDRQPHTIDDIAAELGYKNKRSFMNTKVINLMVTMGLLIKEGQKEKQKVTMTDRAFPAL